MRNLRIEFRKHNTFLKNRQKDIGGMSFWAIYAFQGAKCKILSKVPQFFSFKNEKKSTTSF